MYEFIIIEQHNLRAKMPATQSLNFTQLGCFMTNVTHFVYTVLLLFEVLYVSVVHTMGPRNGGRTKGAIFHFVLV